MSTKDPQAGFTRRGQRSFFGFKAHVAVDLGSDLIRDAVLTGADVGDSLAADGLIQGDEAAVFMDKAYDSAPRREALAEAGIADGIMHRGHARRPLTAWQRWMNTALAPIRGQVERAFGTLKRSYGWRRVHYRGLLRNVHLHLLCAAMKLRRAKIDRSGAFRSGLQRSRYGPMVTDSSHIFFKYRQATLQYYAASLQGS